MRILVISRLKICAIFPFCRFGGDSAIMIGRIFLVVAIGMRIIKALEVNAIDPDYSSLLLHREIEHRPWNGANKPSISTTALPPLLGHAAIVKHSG